MDDNGFGLGLGLDVGYVDIATLAEGMICSGGSDTQESGEANADGGDGEIMDFFAAAFTSGVTVAEAVALAPESTVPGVDVRDVQLRAVESVPARHAETMQGSVVGENRRENRNIEDSSSLPAEGCLPTGPESRIMASAPGIKAEVGGDGLEREISASLCESLGDGEDADSQIAIRVQEASTGTTPLLQPRRSARNAERATASSILAHNDRVIGDSDDGDAADPTFNAPKRTAEIATVQSTPRNICPIEVHVPRSSLVVPRFMYQPFNSPAPLASEAEALEILCGEIDDDGADSGADSEGLELELDQFVIYGVEPGSDPKAKAKAPIYEMKPLQELGGRACQSLRAAGVLSAGSSGQGKSFWVQDLSFNLLPIAGYGPGNASVDGQIWIGSDLVRKRKTDRSKVWYRLKTPSIEYVRFWEPFAWIADLAKHFVDFVEGLVCGDDDAAGPAARRPGPGGYKQCDVSLCDFRSAFSAALAKSHGESAAFRRWHAAFGKDDFRTAVVANRDFLFKEAVDVLGHIKVAGLTLWKEMRDFNAYPEYPAPERDGPVHKTVVTPYTYKCFEGMPFASILEPTEFSRQTSHHRNAHLADQPSLPRHTTRKAGRHTPVRRGDVISIQADPPESGRAWKSGRSRRWYMLVQDIRMAAGKALLNVTWMYLPWDTPCGETTRYPWTNELFLSDHCTCDESKAEYAWVREDDVLGVHSVEFGGSPDTTAEFFCRQTYLTVGDKLRWISWTPDQLECSHRRHRSEQEAAEVEYQPGTTLLVQIDSGSSSGSASLLEPCVFTSKSDDGKLQLRRLLRRSAVDRLAATRPAPNEVVFSDMMIEMPRARARHAVQGRCYVRCLQPSDTVPVPYDRRGVGNLFFMTSRVSVRSGDGALEPLSDADVASIRQGFDPSHTKRPKLRGLDLFCGGGNFGRGLEEGGAIKMLFANDYTKLAMHTYMANASSSSSSSSSSSPDAVTPFLGSIDDLQRLAITGEFDSLPTPHKIPRPGQIDFVSGGSPCPGFSVMTDDKTTPKQRKNQSLIAAFVSAVDLYRPRLGLLENVMGLVSTNASAARHREQRPKSRGPRDPTPAAEEDVCGQLIAAVLGMGYQAQFFSMTAVRYGAPQKRARVFLVFAAPGYALPRKPRASHPYQRTWISNNRGVLPNGELFIERDMDLAVFDVYTSSMATADLPHIGEARPNACIPFPDHRTNYLARHVARRRHAVIPMHPYGESFATSFFPSANRYRQSPLTRPPAPTASDRACFPSDGDRKTPSLRISPSSNAWARVPPNNVFETVTTLNHPEDGKTGRWLHWDQPRPITVMEARRAQGFLDHEVILGGPREQWKTIGNSVSREVSLSLGLAIREAWCGSLVDGEEGGPLVQAGMDLPLDIHEGGAAGQQQAEGAMEEINASCIDDDSCSTPADEEYSSDHVEVTVEVEFKPRLSSRSRTMDPTLPDPTSNLLSISASRKSTSRSIACGDPFQIPDSSTASSSSDCGAVEGGDSGGVGQYAIMPSRKRLRRSSTAEVVVAKVPRIRR